jgi:6-pyruvoyl tetrahydropterin synthase-related domain
LSDLIRNYKLKFYINASHAIRWEKGIGKQHNHTWEFICEITTQDNHMIVFSDIEKSLENYFTKFSGMILNEVVPFDELNPTLENFAEVLFLEVSEVVKAFNANLIRIEVGETPVRFFCISRK